VTPNLVFDFPQDGEALYRPEGFYVDVAGTYSYSVVEGGPRITSASVQLQLGSEPVVPADSVVLTNDLAVIETGADFFLFLR
jgi:hypothetical protein